MALCHLTSQSLTGVLTHCREEPCRTQRRSQATRAMAGGAGDASAGKRQRLAEMYKQYKQESFPEGRDVTCSELHKLLHERPSSLALVDTRTKPETDVSIIPGAMTLSDFEERKRELLGTKKIVAYCTVGLRSGKYAEELRREGADASNLAGSILAWTQDGYPLADGVTGEPTQRVHVYADKWAIQGDGYEPVTFSKGRGALAALQSMMPRWLRGG